MLWQRKKKKYVEQHLIDKLERAVMLIETAWMDIEPIPVEVAARDEVCSVVKILKARSA